MISSLNPSIFVKSSFFNLAWLIQINFWMLYISLHFNHFEILGIFNAIPLYFRRPFMFFVIQRIKSRTIPVLQDAKLIRFYSTVKAKMWLVSNLYMENGPNHVTWPTKYSKKLYRSYISHLRPIVLLVIV